MLYGFYKLYKLRYESIDQAISPFVENTQRKWLYHESQKKFKERDLFS